MGTVFEALRGKYWLWVGSLVYLIAAGSSIIRSLEPTSFIDNAAMAITWLSSCVIYFFLGGLIGILIDVCVAAYRKERIKIPLWTWLILGFWLQGSLLIAITSRSGLLHPALIAFFPWAFGIFYVGAAFVILNPDFITKALYGRIYFDALVIAIFSYWLYLEVSQKKKVFLKRALLIALFFIFVVGFAGCVKVLA
ncbi:MAG TPA: hypothetical protein VK158_04490 [Acidobacteriota bacterium]|nr:hypothetical protein [Acidobacteriota bacterium]